MNIAIDCADLDYDRIDGTRVYIKNLLDQFGRLDTESKFVLYHKNKFNSLLKPEIFPNYQEKRINYPFWWTQTGFGFELRWDKPDVCWMPIQQVPFLAPKKTKMAVTIHDLAFKVFPDSFPLLDRRKLDFFTETAVKRADKLIAVSEATKRDILKYYPKKVKEEKISVVYHGVDKNNFTCNSNKSKQTKILDRRKLKNAKYLLYVGAIQPRKNIEVLVEAFEKIKEQKEHQELKLVIVGKEAWKSEKTMARIRRSPCKSGIVIIRDADFQELPAFYQNAEVFILPSLYEGFGLPLLEAFACGTPAVVADNSSLAEIAADAALKFLAYEPDSLKNQLERILSDSKIRKKMIQSGKERVKQFSWKKCAKKTLEEIKNT
ncbi:MAG: glycosyltransferase family 1 protein [Candidatus Moranbacteria bacterium]|nr:glycosyltransferase family 1 protein [Candidatus Moranbacteria bacterium]